MNFDRATSRAWLEVNEDHLIQNYTLAGSLCREGTTLICVLKANAYGLGLERVGQTLWEQGARFFAVACADEALALYRVLPKAKILIMGVSGTDYVPELIEKEIRMTIGTLEEAKTVSDIAGQMKKQAYVHVKLDTGLHRLGFSSAAQALEACKLPDMIYEGLYSHLALRSAEQSMEQWTLFHQISDELAQHQVHFQMRHLLDSIGLTRFPDWQLDAVRVGAFLYGNIPPKWQRFSEGKPTVRFCARVTRVACVPKGQGVGYDDVPLERDTRIATVSVGYVDGYPRIFSGIGKVSIRGKQAKVLGIICMDQMMVDVTEIDACMGDEVVLLGGEISLVEYAALGHLNRNECTALVSRRVPRVYMRCGKCVCIESKI